MMRSTSSDARRRSLSRMARRRASSSPRNGSAWSTAARSSSPRPRPPAATTRWASVRPTVTIGNASQPAAATGTRPAGRRPPPGRPPRRRPTAPAPRRHLRAGAGDPRREPRVEDIEDALQPGPVPGRAHELVVSAHTGAEGILAAAVLAVDERPGDRDERQLERHRDQREPRAAARLARGRPGTSPPAVAMPYPSAATSIRLKRRHELGARHSRRHATRPSSGSARRPGGSGSGRRARSCAPSGWRGRAPRPPRRAGRAPDLGRSSRTVIGIG